MCISNIGNRRPFPKVAAALKTTSAPSKPHHPHLIVEHHYRDHANDAHVEFDHPARGGVTTPFPIKLHSVLQQVEADGLSHVISWQPHGRCFVVHDPKKFTELLPHYFKLSKLASFQRQLNLYGFQRITRGRDRGGYYHELFLKNRVFLCHSIQRIKVKGTGVRARSNPDQEPDFWSMPWVKEGEGNDAMVMSQHQHQRSVSAGSSCSAASSSSSASPVPSSPLHLDSHNGQSDDTMYNNTGLPASFYSQKSLLSLDPISMQQDDPEDEILFGKHFFGVDQESDIVKSAPPPPENLDQQLLASEIDAFFENFDFPDDIGNEIEDDAVFGELLEQMIS